MRKILIAALVLPLLAACLDDPAGPDLVPCNSLLTQVSGVTGDTVTTSSGLQYIDRQLGAGTTVASGQSLDVHYTLSLASGSVLESSCVYRETLAFVTGRNELIPGFEQGVIGMRVGGVRRVIIPPSLAYGSSPGHPLQNETLVFDIEIVELN